MWRSIAIGMLALFSQLSQAILPESGWYWNPTEPGRGFNIEIQDKSLFMAGFLYDTDGKPVWVVSGGPMASDRSFVADVFVTTAGQCLGCGPAPASEVPWGTVDIDFLGDGVFATLTFTRLGTIHTINVMRMMFAFDFSGDTPQPLLGEWAIVEGETTFPLYFGERIALTRTMVDGTGTLFAAGNRSGSTSRVAVGFFSKETAMWAVLLDSSSDFYELYVFAFTALNRIEGFEYLFRKTEEPTTGGYFLGTRIKSLAAAQHLAGPGFGKGYIDVDAVMEAKAKVARSTIAEVNVIGMARQLKAQMLDVGN